MKALLIVGSLLANLVLGAVLMHRPSLAPPIVRDFFLARTAAAPTPATQTNSVAVPPRPRLWTQFETSDLHSLIQRLQTAGFPPSIIRSMIASLVDAQYLPQIRAITAPDPNVPFWKTQNAFTGPGDKRLVELQRLQRERNKLIRDLTGELTANDAEATAAQRRRFGNLAPAKIDMIERIEDDYAEMTTAIRAGMNGIELPVDREKLALLANEKRADLAAVLTPDELADYDMRTSPLTNALRGRLTAFNPSDAEYRTIFQAYQALGQKFGGDGDALMMDMRTRNDVQQGLGATLKTALGDARYAEFLRASNPEYLQLTRVIEQQNLAPDTADRAMSLRDSVVQQSAQIAQDDTRTAEEKRTALQSLAQNARLQLTALLPGDAGQALIKRSNWLNLLDRGVGVTITAVPPLIITNDTGATISFGNGTEVRPLPIKRGTH